MLWSQWYLYNVMYAALHIIMAFLTHVVHTFFLFTEHLQLVLCIDYL